MRTIRHYSTPEVNSHISAESSASRLWPTHLDLRQLFDDVAADKRGVLILFVAIIHDQALYTSLTYFRIR